MTGEITATQEGVFTLGSAALKTELDTLNCGAATAGAETTSIILVPCGNNQVQIITLTRTA